MWTLGVYFGMVVLLVAGMLVASWLLGQKHHERATGLPYEAGIASEGSARVRISAKFYLVAMLLSLAGIPVTAGFLGKFYIVAAGAAAATWALIVVLVVASSIGLFYYLRIVVVLYGTPPEPSTVAPRLPAAGAVALAILSGLLLWFGTFPNVLLNAIHDALAGLA